MSLPHHLARKNNGMVGVLVRNTKVPRPIAPVTNGAEPKARNPRAAEPEAGTPLRGGVRGGAAPPPFEKEAVGRPAAIPRRSADH